MKLILKFLKWIGVVILFIPFVVVTTFYYYYVAKPEKAKQNLLRHNPQITKIYSLKNVRGWGEGPDYSGIVRINGERCRVWTSGNGVISDNQCEWNFD